MSNSLTINTPNIVQQNTPLRNVPSGSTAEPDYNVKFVPQTLTEQQQAQARQNIGAAAAGEGGGATINEFVYTRTGEPGEYVGVISCEGYEPKEGDVMIISFTGPFYTEYNPVTLNNGTTNPTVTLLNAEVNATDYDEINPEVNTKWTVRLTKVNNAWVAVNTSTQVQADWNTVDTTMPSYIKNKPTIPADVIPEDESRSFKVVTDMNMIFNNKTNDMFKVYSNGSVVTPDSSKNYLLTRGVSRFVYTRYVDWDGFKFTYFSRDPISPDWNAMTIVRFGDNAGYLCGGPVDGGGNKKIFTKILTTVKNGSVLFWGAYDNNMCTPYSTNSVVFYNKYVWSQGAYGTPVFYGKIIFDNVEVPTNTFDLNSGALPDVTNLEGIYVHRSKETAYKAWLTGLYESGVDLSAVLAKVKVYDFLSDYDENIPGDYPMPMTIPAAPVQSNWNETDTASLAYIQNKPAVAADEITEDRYPSFTLFIDYNKTYDIGSRIVNKYKVYNNGILLTPGGNNGTTYSLTKGKIVFVNTAHDDVTPYAGQFYDTNKPMTWIRMDCDSQFRCVFKCVTAPTNARIFQKIMVSDNGFIEHYGNYDHGLAMPNSPNSVVYFDKYWWSRWSYDGNSTWYGKIIFANVEVPTNTDNLDPIRQPNVSNMDGIYIHRSKVTDFKNWLTGLYQSGADLSAVFAKIKPYDYLSQYDENCPGDAPQPIVLPTVPLTMTDENSTVISGDFVAQNVTITPAV